jgi:hypothetical protein
VRAIIEMGRELVTFVPQDCCWLLVGDWNAVKQPRDKSSSCGKVMTNVEGLVFHQLKAALKVEDANLNSSPIVFSWDNKRRDEIRIFA